MNKPSRSITLLGFLASLGLTVAAQAATVDFEDISVPADSSLSPATGGELTDAAAGYSINGGTPVFPSYTAASDGYGDGGTVYTSNFTDGGVQFPNIYTAVPPVDGSPGYSYWSGWSISSANGVAVPTLTQYQGAGQDDYATPYEYSAYTVGAQALAGGGAAGSANYGVFFDDGIRADETITLPAGTTPVSIDLTNTAYTALSMLYGDSFAFPFQTPGDLYQLTITGVLADGTPIQSSVVVNLAQYTSDGLWIMNQWTNESLLPLTGARTLTFSLSATGPDANDTSGVATPYFFAADNLILAPTPEPSSLVLTLIAGLCAAAVAARRRARRMPG